MNRDVGSISLDDVYDSLLKTSHPGKETTVKRRGESIGPNRLWSSYHPTMTKAKQCKFVFVFVFLDLSNIEFINQVQEYNPTDEAIYKLF